MEEMKLHLKRGEHLLGVLIVKTTDFPWVKCEFMPTASFSEAQPLFDEELNLLEAEAMDAWQRAYERINALGLRLMDTQNGKDIGEFLLHIRGNKAWFRY